MSVRTAVVAGQFYESSRQACLEQIKQLLPNGPIKTELPAKILAGIVPHAGWVFSGDVAGMVLAAIKKRDVQAPLIFEIVRYPGCCTEANLANAVHARELLTAMWQHC